MIFFFFFLVLSKRIIKQDYEKKYLVTGDWSQSSPKVIKSFFMLNSAEHEISPANKFQTTNKCKFFPAKHSWARNVSANKVWKCPLFSWFEHEKSSITSGPDMCAQRRLKPALLSRNLIRVFAVHMKKLCFLGYPKCAQWMHKQIWIFAGHLLRHTNFNALFPT